MSSAMTFIKAYIFPPLVASVAASVVGAVLDLSAVSVSVGAAFGVAFSYWDRDRRAVAGKALQPG